VAGHLEVAGDALGAVLGDGGLGQPLQALGRAGVGAVVVGAAVMVAAARLDEGAVDALDVRAARHDALEPAAGPLDERHRADVAAVGGCGRRDDGGVLGGGAGHRDSLGVRITVQPSPLYPPANGDGRMVGKNNARAANGFAARALSSSGAAYLSFSMSLSFSFGASLSFSLAAGGAPPDRAGGRAFSAPVFRPAPRGTR